MELLILPSHVNSDLDFNSPARSSPCATAPSTPKRLGGEYYFSTPTSPSHIAQFYRDFDDFLVDTNYGGTATKSPVKIKNNGDDFAFDVSQEWETNSMSAEELFDAGVIKPFNPPPARLNVYPAERIAEKKKSTARPLSQTRQKSKKQQADHFTAAAVHERGRERGLNLSSPTSQRAARSLSPIRDTQSSSSSSKGHKKWRLKDFFLFRSASEGRAADKDPLKKYTAAVRYSSSRAIDSPGSGSGSRRKGPVSAHELHYTMNRAVSEDLKKKTFLPYKQGILGRLAFNPAVHALANGFGFSRK